MIFVLSGCSNGEFRFSNNQCNNLDREKVGQLSLRELTANVFVEYEKKTYYSVSTYRVSRIEDYSDNMLESLFRTDEKDIIGTELATCFYYSPLGFKYDDVDTYLRYIMGLSFSEEKINFEFADIKTVEDNITHVLEKFGLNECIFYIYPVSKVMFDNVCDYYDRVIIAEEDDAKKSGEVFGKYREYYYVYVRPTVDGIEIYDEQTGYIEKGTVTFGTTLNIVYTENGIEAFYLSNVYDVDSVEQECLDIISVDEAEIMLAKKYEEMLAYNPATYIDCRLVYIAVPNNFSELTGKSDYYILTPAWCFLDQDGNSILFDAVTGKEII